MSQEVPIIVFSHLRWSWVYQRPQHLLSRLAAGRRVYFVEEPQHEPGGEARWRFTEPEHNVVVCCPLTPVAAGGYADEQIPPMERLLDELLELSGLKSRDYVVWFYTPMALPLLKHLNPSAVVYDVMDELSAFKGAPPALLQRETELYQHADVVFTGGPSLYRAKKERHHNVHCFSSSVDARHFGKARTEATDAADQVHLPRPRLGFYGVIDERMDLELLDKLAEAHPEWQIVMVGPVIKIDPEHLPKRSNISYTGQRSYADLPGYLAGWDVCLLPFARNESTRFISPTKTLEYMAAERPIVSTPITDVAEPYGDIVLLADTPERFIAACEKALALSSEERAACFEKMRGVLAATSWDATVEVMGRLIAEAVQRRSEKRAQAEAEQWLETGGPKTPPVVVIGAGPTGLSAAYHLGSEALVLEKNDQVGGWCRSIEDNGFTFDFAGHIMFSNDHYVHELYQKLLGDNVHWQDREAWVFSKGVYTRYPFQGALYGLPADVIRECIVGAIESRFGAIKPTKEGSTSAPPANGHAKGNGHTNGHGHANGRHDPAKCTLGDVKDCCADGVMESTAKLGKLLDKAGRDGHGEPRNFEEFIYKVWGAGIAKHFAIPYNRKLWAVPLTEMETSWLGGRVPLPDLDEMIEGALKPVPRPMGPNARFGYPLRGGFQALMNGFLPYLQSEIRLNSSVARISVNRRTITTASCEEIPYQYLISTMPLPVLIRNIGDEAPEEIRRAVSALRYTSVKCVNIGVGRENLTDKHWIYYPEDTVFHRIFVQGNASPHCNPPGGFGFTCEITYGPQKPLPCDGGDLIQLCIQDAVRTGFIREDDPIWTANVIDLPHAYVVYDHARKENVQLIRDWLAQHNIQLAGRYSEWEYYNSDHAFIAGKKAAEKVLEQLHREIAPRLQESESGSGSPAVVHSNS